MRYLLSLCLALLIGGGASARELSLQQALEMAAVHSHNCKVARANAAAAEQQLSAAKTERLPTLGAQLQAYWVDDLPLLEVEIMPGQLFSRELGTNENYQSDFRLTLPLFTGGRISSGIDLAGATADYYRALDDAGRDRLDYETCLDYLGLCRMIRLREVARASRKRTAVIVKDVQARYEVGVADSVDILEAQLAFTQADFQVTQARINIRSAEIKLLIRLGLPLSEELILSDSLEEPDPVWDDLRQPVNRAELVAAEAGVDIGRAGVRAEKAAFFPTVSAFADYSYGKPNTNMFSDEWNDNVTVGAQLDWSFNLGNRTGKRRRAAFLQLESAGYQRDEVRERLDREAELALEALRLAHERYLSAVDECEITQQNYQLAQEQHRQGALSANRLVEIEASLTRAESARTAARVDFYIVQSGYFYAVGSEKLGKGI